MPSLCSELEMPRLSRVTQHHAVEAIVRFETAKNLKSETIHVLLNEFSQVIRWARDTQGCAFHSPGLRVLSSPRKCARSNTGKEPKRLCKSCANQACPRVGLQALPLSEDDPESCLTCEIIWMLIALLLDGTRAQSDRHALLDAAAVDAAAQHVARLIDLQRVHEVVDRIDFDVSELQNHVSSQ